MPMSAMGPQRVGSHPGAARLRATPLRATRAAHHSSHGPSYGPSQRVWKAASGHQDRPRWLADRQGGRSPGCQSDNGSQVDRSLSRRGLAWPRGSQLPTAPLAATHRVGCQFRRGADRTPSGRSASRSRLYPVRARTAYTVEREWPVNGPIRWGPQRRSTRARKIASTASGGVSRGEWCGRELRSSRPGQPSAR